MQILNINRKTIVLLGAIIVSSFVVINSFLNFLALIVLWIGIRLLWKSQYSPVFVFIFIYSWLQATVKIFQANILNVYINTTLEFKTDIYLASVLALLGILILSIGMRLGLGGGNNYLRLDFERNLEFKSPFFWFYSYLAAMLIAFFLQTFTYIVPGLSQPILALANLKWAFFLLFTHVAFRGVGVIRLIWFFAFLLEFMMGFGGFFSNFKTVLFFTILGVLSSGLRINGWRILLLGIMIGFLITIGVVWTAIKSEHRSFLNQGYESQMVLVSFADNIGNIFKLIDNLDRTIISYAFTKLLDRIAYVEFFGEVINVVPSQIPYENGMLWWDAIIRPFMPRLLFPDKTAIDESMRASEYTTRIISGWDQGTQISLGYIADSYIDFGPWLMMLPILSIGWFVGRFYRWMVSLKSCGSAIGAGLGTAVVFQMSSIEISNTKLFGGLIVSMLMSWVVAKWIVPLFYRPSEFVSRSAMKVGV